MRHQPLVDTNSQYSFNVSLSNNYLQFSLLLKNVFDKYYSLQLSNDGFPQQLQNIFGDIDLLFECIKSHFEIIPQVGIIKVKANFTFLTKTITKEVSIKLNEKAISKIEYLNLKLKQISQNFSELKTLGFQNLVDKNIINLQYVTIDKQQLNDQLSILQKNMLQVKQQIQQADCKLNQIISEFNKQHNHMNDILQSYIKNSNQQQYIISGQIINKSEKANRKSSQNQMQKQSQTCSKSLYTKRVQENSQKQLNPTQKVNIEAINKPGLYNFTISNNIIKHIGETNEGNQIAFKKRIRVAGKNGFRVKVLQTQNSNIYIGLIQQKYTKLKKTHHVICYFGYDGEIWDQKPIKTMGKGFRKGDIVEVRIKKGVIVWKVNGHAVANYDCDKLNDPIAIFKPFLEIADYGDQIEWLS